MSRTHFTLTQSMILTLIGAVSTAVVTLVPAWGAEAKLIVAALGVIVTAVFPLVNASHARSAATTEAATINASSVEPILHFSPAPMPAPPVGPVAAGLTAAEVNAQIDERLRPIAAALTRSPPAAAA